jgi:hypothetical protein
MFCSHWFVWFALCNMYMWYFITFTCEGSTSLMFEAWTYRRVHGVSKFNFNYAFMPLVVFYSNLSRMTRCFVFPSSLTRTQAPC